MLGDSDFPFTRLIQDQVCGLPGCPFSVSCVDIRDGAARMGLPALSNAKAPATWGQLLAVNSTSWAGASGWPDTGRSETSCPIPHGSLEP